MSVSSQDLCLSCSKLIKQCHKIISCKNCKYYIHKKCTKLKPKELLRLDPTEFTCSKCADILSNTETSFSEPLNDLNENIIYADVNLEKYDRMAFNPLRYQNFNKKIDEEQDGYHTSNNQCPYLTQDQF